MTGTARTLHLSKYDIENKILDYFADRFQRPPTEINRNTNLKVHFNFNDNTWPSLGPALSDEDWMKTLGIGLVHSEMVGHETAAALASWIWGKLTKLVRVRVPSNFSDASLRTLWPNSLPPKPPATRKRAVKKATAAKKTPAKAAKKKKAAKKRARRNP